ncbi:MAG: HAMP domain-containing histidine kinase [Firmicutes bacterium]|nr:HAMP domain-containing histidine kinase [Bacillota bacterium]
MKRLSIKQKIILWFSVALLLIITLITSLTFSIANLVLDENIKERLMSVVSTNVAEIEFSVLYDREEIEQGDQFLEYKDGWLEIDDDFCDFFEGICTALYDENNNLLYGEAPLKLTAAEPLGYTSMGSIRLAGEKFYIYDKPLTGDFEGLWLRGVVSHNETLNVLYNVLRLSFWLLPLLAVLSLLGGYVITRRAFLPIQQIADTAEEIGRSGNLSKRLDIGSGSDEIHMLADTFNKMFGRLEKSFETERQFTSDASHELRTPVAVIMAQSEYALELADTEEEYRESLEVIQRQSRRMNDIINQLLFFTRLDQGSEPVRKELCDISSLLEDLAAEQSVIGAKGITLHADIQPGITAETDRNLFTRMVTNLISNAYKYGKENGSIWLSLRHSGNSVVLSVKDDGIGISRENLEKIWDRFYQVDPSRSEDTSGGLGLGLSMVKQISGLLGGTISVDSSPEEGTEFIFNF